MNNSNSYKITGGLTNQSFKKNNTFFQEKTINSFNHKINYKNLEQFDFVPKLLENNKDTISWEWIDGELLKINNENLTKLAHLFKQLHTSKLELPNSNHAARVKEYRNILKNKGYSFPVLEKYYRKINLILKNMDKSVPLHNDLWDRNIIVRHSDQKIFIVDWEYASKGDKHFDLAYFIESSRLTDEQETVFLNAYDDYDYEFIIQHKIFVNYLVILWYYSQDEKPPFDDVPFHTKIETLNKELELFKEKLSKRQKTS